MIITAKEVKTYLAYNWWKVLMLSMIAIIIWTILINEIITPNENQRINISVVNVSLDVELLQNKGLEVLSEYENQDIQQVNVYAIEIASAEFHEYLSTRALPGTDLIILPGSSILENTASDLFLPLDEVAIKERFGDEIGYYYEGDTLFGISLINDAYDTNFESYLSTDAIDEYYVFINAYSRNIGDWNEDSTTGEEAAQELILWLISNE